MIGQWEQWLNGVTGGFPWAIVGIKKPPLLAASGEIYLTAVTYLLLAVM